MKTVFEYTNYRQFLADWFRDKKRRGRFSYQALAVKAGFQGKSYLHGVLAGKKNLSPVGVVRLADLLELKGSAARYFEALVKLNHAMTGREKRHHWAQMESIRTTNGAAARTRTLVRDQYEFFSQWYMPALRSLLELRPFRGDFKRLGRAFRPALTPSQVKRALELLERLGLATHDAEGVWRVQDKLLSTGPEVESLAVLEYHKKMLEKAGAALDDLPRAERNVTGLTLGISRAAYGKICDEIREFHERILGIAEADRGSDGVYQLSLSLFPLAQLEKEESTP